MITILPLPAAVIFLPETIAAVEVNDTPVATFTRAVPRFPVNVPLEPKAAVTVPDAELKFDRFAARVE